ncbi:hypothetical protein P7D22_21500 [Lichenihabitans sp. Uapishka_5]|uniref:hypothetical protein n=1 Tax=Lichenihabitans sp. Uapishka_5 TaxID=3037302 RepID=UPI0029E7F701|nr:hypothetical protein [Lichenihabitans sp. Uapishka_5]MDX7953744.1 hypothetical protein [Lichenihabitans sp. Uapishka_5]
MTKRPIAPIKILGVTPVPPQGERPEVTWIAPTEIRVEDRYQRSIGERGRKLIATIYGSFDWRLWRLPICVWTDEGLEAVDGQHGLIAAASLGIAEVPIMIVDAAKIQDRAGLFVNVNKDRLALSYAQLHAAKVLAGDADAVRLGTMCAAYGINLLRAPPPRDAYKPRETIAIQTIAALLRRYEQGDVERILAAIANTDAAPVSAVQLRAAEHLLTTPEFAGEIDSEMITAAILSLPDWGEQEAKLFAATHCVPVWRALASIWFKASKKMPKRQAPKLASVPAAPVYVPPAPRAAPPVSTGPIIAGISRTATGGPMIDRRPTSRIVELGDLPGPGRSALDQRRAGA